MKLTLTTILLTCLFINVINGQEDCAFTLSKAQKLYDAGQIEQIQLMLQPCIENGFTKEEKQAAQKLIIQTNLFDKNTKSADSAMLQFLKKYPEYEIVASDQAEFVQLFDTYRTLPIAALGIIGGINYTNVVKNSAYNINTSANTYTSSLGIQIGLAFRKQIISKYDVSLDLFYQQNKYTYTANNDLNSTSTNFQETQSVINAPLSIIYTPIDFGKLSLFARVGTTFSYSIGSTGNLTASPKDASAADLSGITINDVRVPFQIFGLLGAGSVIKIPHSFIQIDVRYNIGFLDQVPKNKKNLSDPISVNNSYYGYPQNGFKISNLAFNLGWFYKFYSPRKK